jgi:hypothetical protein
MFGCQVFRMFGFLDFSKAFGLQVFRIFWMVFSDVWIFAGFSRKLDFDTGLGHLVLSDWTSLFADTKMQKSKGE